jgi:hypothetical protein
MTDVSSGEPNTPEQQPVEASPDEPTTPEQNQTDFSQNGPSSAAEEQEPAKSRPRRSNEFWLALVAIAATLIVGTTGSWLAYLASTNQVKAESDRAALSFSREQRKNAYADYLDAVAILRVAEYQLWDKFKNVPFDMKQAEDQSTREGDAFLKFNTASSTVRLLASPDVEAAREKIRDKHNHIQDSIYKLMVAARTGPPEKVTGPAADLYKDLDLLGSPLVPDFIKLAQRDLGLAGN